MWRQTSAEQRFAVKWTCIALATKTALFVFFASNFLANWPAFWIINKIFIVSGDTLGYYEPVESFVSGHGYNSYCRMPGLLPIYGPLAFLFGPVWGKTLVILLQLIVGSLSVYLLASTARRISGDIRIFYITFFLYAGSSFVSIWDHYGLSDSFSVSFLVISFYFFVRHIVERKNRLLMYSGIFAAWSVFFRPVNGIVVPCYLVILLIHNRRQVSELFRRAFVLLLPLMIAIAAWTTNNVVNHGRVVFLQGSFSDCNSGSLPEEHLAIRAFIIGLGGDFQQWSKGSEAEWFFSHKIPHQNEPPIAKKHYSSTYDADSLRILKRYYDTIHHIKNLPVETASLYKERIIDRSARYAASYRSEHPFRYFFLNRCRLLARFIFPSRLDDLPFPGLASMSLLQKMIKGGYLLLLNLIVILGLSGILVSLVARKNYYGIIPLAFLIGIGSILGFIEQRYLVPSYPFLCVYASFALALMKDLLSRLLQPDRRG